MLRPDDFPDDFQDQYERIMSALIIEEKKQNTGELPATLKGMPDHIAQLIAKEIVCLYQEIERIFHTKKQSKSTFQQRSKSAAQWNQFQGAARMAPILRRSLAGSPRKWMRRFKFHQLLLALSLPVTLAALAGITTGNAGTAVAVLFITLILTLAWFYVFRCPKCRKYSLQIAIPSRPSDREVEYRCKSCGYQMTAPHGEASSG